MTQAARESPAFSALEKLERSVEWGLRNIELTRVGVKDTIRTLKTNKPLGILCASSFFYLIGLFAVGGATAYYAIYVLGDAKYIIWMTLVTVIAQSATAPSSPSWSANSARRISSPIPIARPRRWSWR